MCTTRSAAAFTATPWTSAGLCPTSRKCPTTTPAFWGITCAPFSLPATHSFANTALGILGFLENVLSHPEAGFYASQDADISLDDDGDYFTWMLDELNAALDGPEARVRPLLPHRSAGQLHYNPAKNVLLIDQPLHANCRAYGTDEPKVAEPLASAKQKMAEARARRQTPFIDKSIYTSWNGMLVSALLETYRVLGIKGERDRALATLDLLMTKAYNREKGMYHTLVDGPTTYRGVDRITRVYYRRAPRRLRDYGNTPLLRSRAGADWKITVRRFWDEKEGGFFDTAQDVAHRHGSLERSAQAVPGFAHAGRECDCRVRARLPGRARRSRRFWGKAAATLALFAPKAGQYGLFAATYGLALHASLECTGGRCRGGRRLL